MEMGRYLARVSQPLTCGGSARRAKDGLAQRYGHIQRLCGGGLHEVQSPMHLPVRRTPPYHQQRAEGTWRRGGRTTTPGPCGSIRALLHSESVPSRSLYWLTNDCHGAHCPAHCPCACPLTVVRLRCACNAQVNMRSGSYTVPLCLRCAWLWHCLH